MQLNTMSGIFYVEFAASNRDAGAGLAVIDNGRVNGGDATYLYRGRVDHYAGDARATIEVTHYRGQPNSVMGPLRQFTLILSGRATEDRFEFEGGTSSAPGIRIRMVGQKVAPLFE